MTEQPQPQPPTQPPSMLQPRVSKVWVVVVLAFGILLGAVLALSIPQTTLRFGPGGFFLLSVKRALQVHVVLTTIEMVLLASLVYVYIKTYVDTRANFAMGVLFVLVALLINSILSYPLSVNQIGPIVLGSGAFFPYTDLLTIIAFTIFLYLSLE